MTEERMSTIIAAYGSDLLRWPAEERAAARELLHRQPSAWALLTEARRLDALLELDRPLTAGADLSAAILARAAATPQQTVMDTPAARPQAGSRVPPLFDLLRRRLGPGAFWPQMASLAAAMIIGFMIGSSGVVDFGNTGNNSVSAGLTYESSDWGALL